MKRYYYVLFIILSVIVFYTLFLVDWNLDANANIVLTQDDSVFNKIKKVKETILYPTQPRHEGMFESVVLDTNQPLAQLTNLVGKENIDIVLRINRIDVDHLESGMTLIIPKDYEDLKQWQYMPYRISAAEDIPKLVIVSQPVQAFGVYENGVLVRSGPVSSGKKLNQTPDGLFFVNWKGEEVVSTVDDEWILRWNMNIDNLGGVALHQYNLPGYPASHSCVRMTEADAYWLYHWVEQWTWKGGHVVTEGTPVVVYSNYDFDNPAPWTLLVENPKATDTPRSILENLIKSYLKEIKSATL